MINNLSPNINLPRWVSNKAIGVYVAALAVVSFLYMQYMLPWYYLLSGIVGVTVFFLAGRKATRSWSFTRISPRRFERNVFTFAFFIRLAWMLLIYTVFMNSYGDAFGFDNADSTFYHEMGQFVAGMISDGNSHFTSELEKHFGVEISDTGYATYVGFIYFLTDNSILAVRLLKCVWSALTCVLVYRLARRNFGEEVARMAAIFCMLWPNFWYYCGVHLKEVEMVFLGTLFVNQADDMLKSKNFSAWKIIIVFLISGALFTIRTPLAVVTILCLLFSIVMSSAKVVSWGKRIIVGVLAISLIGLTMGNRIQEEAMGLLETAQSDTQQKNMEWRSVRKDAAGHQNLFAKYAGAAVFAPMIFSLPFPTMTSPFDGQDVQKLLNGGNFVKNILSFFTLLSMFILLFSGRWRRHLVPLSFMLGYLVVLVMSVFAQSERFHQPAMPMEMMFAAYGISLVLQGVPIYKRIGNIRKYKKWFTIWLIFMFVIAMGWNWFKLAGRGMA